MLPGIQVHMTLPSLEPRTSQAADMETKTKLLGDSCRELAYVIVGLIRPVQTYRVDYQKRPGLETSIRADTSGPPSFCS